MKKIGIALGGGGARGVAHIGVLKTLEKAGISPDYVVGVSMGSLIGAYYCLGFDLDYLEEEVCSLTKSKAIKKFLDLNNPKKSLIKGKKIEKYIDKINKESTFKDLKKPFKVVSTDLFTGEEVVLDEGNLTKALMSSISVPGIFPPVKLKGRYLVDGGVMNTTPVNVVEDMGADIIIGVDLVIQRGGEVSEPNIFSSLIQSYEVIRSQGAKSKLKDVSKKLIVIEPHLRETVDSFKFYDMRKFIRSGEIAAEKVLGDIL